MRNSNTEKSTDQETRSNGAVLLSETLEPGSANGQTTSSFANLEEHRLAEEEHSNNPASVFENLDEHRLDLDDDDDIAEEVLTTIPVRRPGKHWIRVHPTFEFPAVILEDKDTGENYYVMPEMRALMTEDGEARKVTLVLCINRRKIMFFWPVSSQGTWRSTALIAAERGKSTWIKAIADKALNGYRIKVSKLDYGEPEWGEYTLNQLLDLAFPQSHIISSVQHPLAKDV
jgi:hypothetical protein